MKTAGERQQATGKAAREFAEFPDTELQWGSWSETAYIESLGTLRGLPVRSAYFSHDARVFRS